MYMQVHIYKQCTSGDLHRAFDVHVVIVQGVNNGHVQCMYVHVPVHSEGICMWVYVAILLSIHLFKPPLSFISTTHKV